MNFRTATNHENPPTNHCIFEEYFGNVYNPPALHEKSQRYYLDVFWTNYYISKSYCNLDMSDLQNYLNQLDTSKKYYTICQWDDGIQHDVSHLDLVTFSSGGVGDYAIPLNCNQQAYPENKSKRFLASFIGAIFGRHSVREKMWMWSREIPQGSDEILVMERSEKLPRGYFTSLMSDSVFALCPRGYGKTSFRICEALQAGAIPVYIHDEPWVPFKDKVNFSDYGVLCHVEEIDDLLKKLKGYDNDTINKMLSKGREVYQEYYSFEGCAKNIMEVLDENYLHNNLRP